MNFQSILDWFVKYWTQVVVFFGAIGFILKFIFENKSKRQYRKFEMYQQAKLEAFLKFIECYYDFYYNICYLNINFQKRTKIITNDKIFERYIKSFNRICSLATKQEKESYCYVTGAITSIISNSTYFNELLDNNGIEEEIKKCDVLFQQYLKESLSRIESITELNMASYR